MCLSASVSLLHRLGDDLVLLYSWILRGLWVFLHPSALPSGQNPVSDASLFIAGAINLGVLANTNEEGEMVQADLHNQKMS